MEENQDLRIVEIMGRNFKCFEVIEVKLSDGHTKFYGGNGAGKTSLKQIVSATFEGIGQNKGSGIVGDRFRYIGKHGTAADTKITMQDVKGNFTVIVTNHITAKGNDISIVASDGRMLTKEWLKELFNSAFLSAETFIAHTPKEQALLLGINTSEYDHRIANIKEVAKQVRRDLKAIGEVKDLDKVERVDTNALSAEKDGYQAHNKKQEDRAEKIERYDMAVKNQELRLKSLMAGLKREEAELKRILKVKDTELTKPESLKNLELTSVKERIANADDTNRAAQAYEDNKAKRETLDKTEKELDQAQTDIKTEEVKRTEYIKEFKLPLDGLSVDEAGGLLINDQRLASLSTGEQVITVTKLLASQNPHYKTVMVDNFETLDPDNQKQIADFVVSEGFNIATFEVGTEAKEEGGILIEGCKIAE